MTAILSKPKKESYQALIPAICAGIPCLLGVTHFHHQRPWRGSPHNCPSSDDYHGYTEIEYDILDRKGYRARWLEAKADASPLIREALREAILSHFSQESDDL